MEEVLNKILNELTGLRTDVTEIKADMTVLKEDVAGLKTDVAVLKTDVAELKTDVAVLKTDMSEVKNDIVELKAGQVRIETKLDAVYNQTADLTEFRTETQQNFQDVKDSIRFLYHKEMETEKELFLLKSKNF